MSGSAVNIIVTVLLLMTYVDDVTGHGGMVEPPMRSVMWRYGFDSPINYDWNSLYCGGFHNFQQHGGKCGLCGDPVQGPLENDRGGQFDTGIIVRHYPAGLREIEVKVEITAHHKGFFTFKLCPNNAGPLTAGCLDRYPLRIRESSSDSNPLRYYPPENPKLHELHVILPPGLTCDRCVMQWTYTAGNSDGLDRTTGRRCVGCGLQETFVNCADISIGGTVDNIQVDNTGPRPNEAGGELIIPASVEVTEAITNASPETTFHDVMRNTGVWQPGPIQTDTRPAMIQRDRVHRMTETQPDIPARPPPTPISGARPMFPGPAHENRALATDAGWASFQGTRINLRHPDVRRTSSGTYIPFPNLDMRRFNMNRRSPNTNMPLGDTGDRQAGYQSSLLSSLDPLINENHGVNPNLDSVSQFHMRQRELELRRREREMYDMRMREMRFREWQMNNMAPNDTAMPRNAVAMPMLPGNVPVRRSDGMTSHQAAVRPVSRLPTAPFSTETRSVNEILPDLSNNAGPPYIITSRSDAAGIRQPSFAENWFPDAQRRMQASQQPGLPGMQGSGRLPRRIVVHSMSVAQHLLRKYPYLRGRVYLSQQAHRSNKFAHMSHKYARRQRW